MWPVFVKILLYFAYIAIQRTDEHQASRIAVRRNDVDDRKRPRPQKYGLGHPGERIVYLGNTKLTSGMLPAKCSSKAKQQHTEQVPIDGGKIVVHYRRTEEDDALEAVKKTIKFHLLRDGDRVCRGSRRRGRRRNRTRIRGRERREEHAGRIPRRVREAASGPPDSRTPGRTRPASGRVRRGSVA